MRVVWHIMGRFFEARATRARLRGDWAGFVRLTARAEKFFARLDGGRHG